MSLFELNEEIELYYDTGHSKKRLLWELLNNSYRVINSVYIFKNFEEYGRQLASARQEDKNEVYWNGAYHEKLIDYIKIIIAFETFNKVLLIKKGILIHKIDKDFNKQLERKQSRGIPIKIEDFFQNNNTSIDFVRRNAELNGLNKNLATISFSQTLNDHYQSILGLDKELVNHLKDINVKRNRLHLYSDFKGAFNVSHHIKKWKYIKETSIVIIKNELDRADNDMKSY